MAKAATANKEPRRASAADFDILDRSGSARPPRAGSDISICMDLTAGSSAQAHKELSESARWCRDTQPCALEP